jgi:hypothetical protein
LRDEEKAPPAPTWWSTPGWRTGLCRGAASDEADYPEQHQHSDGNPDEVDHRPGSVEQKPQNEQYCRDYEQCVNQGFSSFDRPGAFRCSQPVNEPALKTT